MKTKLLKSATQVFVVIAIFLFGMIATGIINQKKISNGKDLLDSLRMLHSRDSIEITRLIKEAMQVRKLLEAGATGKDTVFYQDAQKNKYIIKFEKE